MPLRFGASTSVRASSRHQSACRAPLAHSFCPLTTKRSPSRRAVVRRLARSEPASGSENPWHQISPSRMAGRCRRRCSSVPATSSVDAAWWIDTKASTRRGASWAASSWYSTTCCGDRHAAAPLGRPVRHRVPGRPQPLEPVLLEGDELVLGHAGLRGAPPLGHVGATPRPHLRPEVGEIAHRCTRRTITRTAPTGPGCRRGRRARRGSPTARTAGGAAAGWPGTATTAPSRRRTRWRRGAGGSTRNTTSAASIAASRSASASATASGCPVATLHSAYLASSSTPDPLDLGVGELELHALERRQRLAELVALLHVVGGDGRSARSSMPSSVQHGSTRPRATSPAPASSTRRERPEAPTRRACRPARRRRAAGWPRCAARRGRRRPTAAAARRRRGRGRPGSRRRRRRPARPPRRRAGAPAARRRGAAAAHHPALRHRAAAASSSSALPRGSRSQAPRSASTLAAAPPSSPAAPGALRPARRRPRPRGPGGRCGRTRRPRRLRSVFTPPPAGPGPAGSAASRCCRTPRGRHRVAVVVLDRPPEPARLGVVGRRARRRCPSAPRRSPGRAGSRRCGRRRCRRAAPGRSPAWRRRGRRAAGPGGRGRASAPSGRAARRAGRPSASPSAAGAHWSSRSTRA